jgi:hypothetical protein
LHTRRPGALFRETRLVRDQHAIWLAQLLYHIAGIVARRPARS